VEPFVRRELGRTYVQSNSDNELLCVVSIPYVEGASVRFKGMSEHYNIRTDFKTKYSPGIYLRKTKPLKDKLKDHIFRFCVNVEVIWA
jgi:hypothetical protein